MDRTNHSVSRNSFTKGQPPVLITSKSKCSFHLKVIIAILYELLLKYFNSLSDFYTVQGMGI